ncbi:hypothetical protein [Azospirillum himalayense]|uniref:Uncharacterized protein n=1 Tax=Azospirillum himalayense TaxID=654847 RepID=A0ABW0FXM4_9PROT
MPFALFSQTRVVQDGTGTTFEAGQTYELPRASVDRWVIRGVATEVAPPVSDPVSDLPPEGTAGASVSDEFDPLTADEAALRAYLSAHGATPHHRTGEAKLREMALEIATRAAAATEGSQDA